MIDRIPHPYSTEVPRDPINIDQKISATIKIQSVWRGRFARIQAEKTRKYLLSDALLEKAKPYVDIPSNRQNIPQASSGKTPVYLPKELPIVLKQSGSPDNQKRFNQMRQGRDIYEKNNYKHLVIPKARVYRDFIVESRLPISAHDTKEAIGLYIENRDRFVGAVKEFTGFLCQSSLSDITDGSNDPYGTLSKTPVGRYDNIALYLEEEQGKIGLIDLEGFTPGCSERQKGWCFSKCLDAVHVFPYHLDDILSVAKTFDPDIESYRGDLERARAEALKRFKLAYEDHLEFLRQKGINTENPLQITAITPARRECVQKEMIALIGRKQNEVRYKNCLGEKPEEVIELFQKNFPKILDVTVGFLSEMLTRRIESAKEPISSSQQLVSYRSLYFGANKWYRALLEKVVSELHMMHIEEEWEDDFAASIIQGVFEELVKGKEIAYYNPNFGYGARATQCIFA